MQLTISLARLLLVALLCVLPITAQRGNGAPGAFIETSTGLMGGNLTVNMGMRGNPFVPTILSISSGFGPLNVSGVGPLWLDFTAPTYTVFTIPTDAQGTATLVAPIPFNAGTFNAAPIFANTLVYGPGVTGPGWSLSKTARIQFDTPDGFRPAGTMLEPRANHTATLLARSGDDNVSEVFIAGGGIGSIILPIPSATTEVWSPLTRSFQPGPTMVEPRLAHTATRLDDGRVLIVGGITTGGVITTTAELYDPTANTLTLAPPLATPRGGHRAILLPDGRVMVSGGFQDWQNADTNFVARLNTATPSIELYDPTLNSWQTLATPMAAPRAGHTVTTVSPTEVLIVGGVRGGQVTTAVTLGTAGNVPVFTDTCERFNWVSNSLSPAAPLPSVPGQSATGRGYHAASVLPSGELLVTGGSFNGNNANVLGPGAAVATTACDIWDGTTWRSAPPLQRAVAFHTQTQSNWNGDAIVMGGFLGDFTQLTGSPGSGRHNGSAYGETLEIGDHPLVPGSAVQGRGTHTVTLLQDGSYLILGGSSFPNTFRDAYTVVELQ